MSLGKKLKRIAHHEHEGSSISKAVCIGNSALHHEASSSSRSGKKGQCDSNMCLPIEDSDERMESQELSFFRHQSPPKGLLLLQTRQKDSERSRPILSQDSLQAKLTTYSRVSKTIS